MDSSQLDRERALIEDVKRDLPSWVQACNSLNDFVIMTQDAFAPQLGASECLLLGKAIKYAGLVGKEVRVIPSPSVRH
jgi:hypothetical protein